MVVAAEDKAALEALKSVYFDIEALRVKNPSEFIFFNKMHSPIKKIQGKVRYQVLMRLKSNELLPRIYEVAVAHAAADVAVYVEENPINLS
jgi:primosomal protein N'